MNRPSIFGCLRILLLCPFLSYATEIEMDSDISSGGSGGSYASAGSYYTSEAEEPSTPSDEESSTASPSPEHSSPDLSEQADLKAPNPDDDHDTTITRLQVRTYRPVSSDNILHRWPSLTPPIKVYVSTQAFLEVCAPIVVGFSGSSENLALAAIGGDTILIGGRFAYSCFLNHRNEEGFKKVLRHTILESFAILAAWTAWDHYNHMIAPEAHPHSFGWAGSMWASAFSALVFFAYAINQ